MLKTFDTYAAAQGMSAQVRDEWRGYIKKLKAFVGHDDLRALTADDLRRWRDHLRDEPSRTGRPRTAHTIRSKYIASVRAMLKWAVEERLVPTNVATEVTVRVPKKTKLRDKDFTHEEAIAILAASLVPASKNMAAGHARARRWIPWLCAYSGGRVNEYSQLRVEDVQEIEGIWTLNITPDAGSVKSREARQVPIHEHLLAQGFQKMVEACGKGPIFYDPESQRVDGDANRHFKKVGERLATWVRKEVGITDPGIKPTAAVMMPSGATRRPGAASSCDVVLNILTRQRQPPAPLNIVTPDALRLRHEPRADCARYDSLRRPYGTPSDPGDDGRAEARRHAPSL